MTTTDAPAVKRPEEDHIHLWFGLSYASYLVLNRTLLQSMPDEWQKRFVAMLNELDEAFDHIESPEGYQVKAGHCEEVCSLTREQRRRLGISRPGGGSVYYDEDGNEMDAHSMVIVPGHDPVPHYSRGRTYVEPRLDAIRNMGA